MIESTIHQIWHPFAAAEMPVEWRRFSSSWRRSHPKHEHVLWGPEESRRLVAGHYPGFLATYDGYSPIQRVDALRVLLLHHFGGIYADLDIECLRNVEPLLEGRRIVIPGEPVTHTGPWRARYKGQILSSAFLASEAGHPFWNVVIDEFQRSSAIEGPLESTGPFALTRAFERYPDRLAITVASPDSFYPLAAPECQDGSAYDLEGWVHATRKAYGIHHWAASWKGSQPERRRRGKVYRDGLPISVWHPQPLGGPSSAILTNGPLVSCIMLAGGRKAPACWTIESFQNQSHRNRELLIVTGDPSDELGTRIEELRDPRIRFVGAFPNVCLDELRGRALAEARGEFVCAWDEGGLSGADRLAVGMTAIITTKIPVVVLDRICVWNPRQRQFLVSRRGHWENTLIAHRSALPRVRQAGPGQGGPLLRLAGDRPIIKVGDPNLFVQVITGRDPWNAHQERSFLEAATFEARGADYERALTVVDKHVPVTEYLEWLQELDPGVFGAAPGARESLASADAGDQAPRSPPPGTTTFVSGTRAVLAGDGRRLRFLLASELGAGAEDIHSLAQVARSLLQAGHEVHLALPDLSLSPKVIGDLARDSGLVPWQAPCRGAGLRDALEPSCYAELLSRAGFLDPARLSGLISGWKTLFARVQPDLLLVDHAPTALLAGRGFSFRRAILGSGFYLPLRESPMPSFREWEPAPAARLEEAERRVLETCNAILSSQGLPLLDGLTELLSADERFLVTVPELDPFQRRSRDPGAGYRGNLTPVGSGRPVQWPAGVAPRLLVRLRSEYPGLERVVRTIAEGPWAALACFSGEAGTALSELSSSSLGFLGDPDDMTAACSSCDVVVCTSDARTIATALQAGKPLLMLPSQVEELLLARRVQRLGAGALLLEEQLERLRSLLQELTGDGAYRAGAQAFAERHSALRHADVAGIVAARCVELGAPHGA